MKKLIKKEMRKKINPIEIMKERRELNKEESLADKLTDDLERSGVHFFQPDSSMDSSYLNLPSDLTEVHSRELGKYLNVFTQQKMYIRTLIGWQETFTEESKREYYNKSQPIYKILSTNDRKMSETAKEREVNNHKDINPLFLTYKDSKRKLDLLNLNIASIEDAIFLISREISRRGGDWDNDNRNYNVNRR